MYREIHYTHGDTGECILHLSVIDLSLSPQQQDLHVQCSTLMVDAEDQQQLDDPDLFFL